MEEHDNVKAAFALPLARGEEHTSQVIEGGCVVDQETLEGLVELRYVARGCIFELVGRPW